MIQAYRYFLIPFTSVPKTPPYTVWFATRSSDLQSTSWSKDRPATTQDPSSTWVVGLTSGDLPPDATLLGTATKDPPPPPLAVLPTTTSLAAYQIDFKRWLESRSA
jgi:hypothetical protein